MICSPGYKTMFIGEHGMAALVWLCATVAVVVCIKMIQSNIVFERSRSKLLAASVHAKAVEFLWTLVPIAIFFGTAVPAVKMLMFFNLGGCSHEH